MYNVQIQHKNSDGNSIPINPLTKSKNVSLETSNTHIPSTAKTVGDVIDNLGSLAFANDIEIPDATTSAPGVVTLSSEIDNITDETKAATTKAVGDVNASAVHKTGDEEINGIKTFNESIVVGGNLKISAVKNQETGEVTVDFTEV